MNPISSRRKQSMCKVFLWDFLFIAIKFPVHCLKKYFDCNSLVFSYNRGTQSLCTKKLCCLCHCRKISETFVPVSKSGFFKQKMPSSLYLLVLLCQELRVFF